MANVLEQIIDEYTMRHETTRSRLALREGVHPNAITRAIDQYDRNSKVTGPLFGTVARMMGKTADELLEEISVRSAQNTTQESAQAEAS